MSFPVSSRSKDHKAALCNMKLILERLENLCTYIIISINRLHLACLLPILYIYHTQQSGSNNAHLLFCSVHSSWIRGSLVSFCTTGLHAGIGSVAVLSNLNLRNYFQAHMASFFVMTPAPHQNRVLLHWSRQGEKSNIVYHSTKYQGIP